MRPRSDNLDAVASDWIGRKDRGLSPEEVRALETWLADPRHAKAFAECEAVWKALARLEPLPTSLPSPSTNRPGRLLATTGVLAAAAAAAVAISLFLAHPHHQSSAAATAAAPLTLVAASDGERIVLPDGSVAFLRAATRARYLQTASARRLVLDAGEVHVTVAKGSALPFFVDTRDVIIRDIGTAFDVRLASDGVGVTVTEGEVRLNAADQPGTAAASAQPVRLVRGQKAWVQHGTAGGQISVSSVPDQAMPEVVAWKSRRLVFDGEPLSEVVRQINQCNVVQLVIVDPSLANKQIAGAVQSDNLDGLVHLLKNGFGIQAQTVGNEIRLTEAP